MQKIKNKKEWAVAISVILIVLLCLVCAASAFGATISGTAKNGQQLVLTYSITKKTASSANVEWTLYVKRTNDTYNTYNNDVTATVKVNGTSKKYANCVYSIKGLSVGAKKKICSGTHKVSRSNGAAKTVAVTASVPTGSTTVKTMSLSGKIAIPYLKISKTVSGKVVWSDGSNRDGKRPSKVSVTLYRNSAALKSVSTASSFSWTGLDTYTQGGTAYTYAVNGAAVTGYTKGVSGTTITYTHTPEKRTISGQVVWNDNNNQAGKRPASVTVYLKNGSTTVATTTATAAGGWKFSFANQYKYAAQKVIAYKVMQSGVTKYTTAVSGTTITNTYTTDYEYRAGFCL